MELSLWYTDQQWAQCMVHRPKCEQSIMMHTRCIKPVVYISTVGAVHGAWTAGVNSP